MTLRRDREGAFNYVAPSVPSSLYRNGRVRTRRDPDGNDHGTEGLELVEVMKSVTDARALTGPERPALLRNGFELAHRPLSQRDLDFVDHDQVARLYYPEAAAIVAEATGAGTVVAFDHNVRSAGGKDRSQRIHGGQQVQAPLHLTHGDYTLRSAPDRMRQLTRPPSGNDTLQNVLPPGQPVLDPDQVDAALDGGRYAIINVWRNIAPEPVVSHPLALCDARTLAPGDLVVFEIHYPDRIGENYFAKAAPAHRWHYFPEMTRDEVLLLEQWDSGGTLAATEGRRGDGEGGRDEPSTFSLHSAFEDPGTPPGAPDRWSIEVRCAVLYG